MTGGKLQTADLTLVNFTGTTANLNAAASISSNGSFVCSGAAATHIVSAASSIRVVNNLTLSGAAININASADTSLSVVNGTFSATGATNTGNYSAIFSNSSIETQNLNTSNNAAFGLLLRVSTCRASGTFATSANGNVNLQMISSHIVVSGTGASFTANASVAGAGVAMSGSTITLGVEANSGAFKQCR